MPSISRRRFLALAAISAASPKRVRAAADLPNVEIAIDRHGWGASSLDDVRAVLVAVAGEIWPYCAGERLKPIHIYHRDDFPLTDFIHDFQGRIRIGLHSGDGRWPQLAFQFGHEFCHALAQHSAAASRGWHTGRHANLWFEESLCETSSLFVLRRLAAAWANQPPAESWRAVAPAMAQFSADRLAQPERQLPPGQSFTDWFRQNEPALRANPNLRDKNVIIARQMLPLFEAEPASWDAACYLNLGKHQKDKSLAQHFAEWQSASPAGIRPLLARLTALFPVA